MTAVIIANVALVAIVFGGIVAMHAWAIRSGRPTVVGRERVARARAAHAEPARAARARRAPGTATGLGA